MTSTEYRQLRESVGTQEIVAQMLGTTVSTLSRRENGHRNIPLEAILALEYLKLAQEVESGDQLNEQRHQTGKQGEDNRDQHA